MQMYVYGMDGCGCVMYEQHTTHKTVNFNNLHNCSRQSASNT